MVQIMIVYTCITAGKDNLKENQVKGKANFIAFIDRPKKSTTWKVIDSPNIYKDPRRNSRYVKTLSHLMFEDEYTIWMDGTMEILIEPEKLIEKYLKDTDIAVFKHPDRNCLYEEGKICRRMHLDDVGLIKRQTERYFREGYPVDNGLAETKVVLRRNTKEVKAFNKMWHEELVHNSSRDQVAFPYIVWKTKIKVTYMPSLFHPLYNNGEFQYYKHLDQ
jgi:hypothetical protein